MIRPVLREWQYTSWRPSPSTDTPNKTVVPLTFHSTSWPKRALLSVLTASLLVVAPPGPDRRACGGAASRQARCGDGERGHGRQANQQASEDRVRGKGRYRGHQQTGPQYRARSGTSQSASTITLGSGPDRSDRGDGSSGRRFGRSQQ